MLPYCKRVFQAFAAARGHAEVLRDAGSSSRNIAHLFSARQFSNIRPDIHNDTSRRSQLSPDGPESKINTTTRCHASRIHNAKEDFVSECDRTFCPPEKVEHCPFLQLGLRQPRGDESLAHRLDNGLHSLKRTLKCPGSYQALFVDAAGTLIEASQSTQQVYREIGLKYGVKLSEDEIADKYKAAYGHPWCRFRMRYEADGRLYWQRIVQEATGCKDPGLLEDLYQYYTTDKAWHIGDPDAEKVLKAIRNAGIKLAVVSNFDTRLRPLMKVLSCYDWFDSIVVSAEVGLEKPNPEIFLTACKELCVKPEQVLHVGDDKTNDLVGASAAGCDSLLWGVEVANFTEVAKKLGIKI
ncbi:hypothetical protein KP509_31G025900 [Ceratopteris richardii]|uniref:Haloacid dehalogenase-like hydrolase domain-containing protein 3 n=1 Tax=Ceratopteris richardii TaxID=49495 RepID=A0A8T2QWD3_CERRI|nr:hypothetical protein KP509_31G025900 [Ceratopteris richardii]